MRIYYHRSMRCPVAADLSFFDKAVEGERKIVLMMPNGRHKFFHSDSDMRRAGYSDSIVRKMFLRYL